MQISPSILAADMTDLKAVLGQMDPAVVDFIHLDVMDGHFVPAISFGEVYSGLIQKHTSIPLDVHLMVSRPDLQVPRYFDLKPANITFHIEATDFPIRMAQLIRAQGIRAGVAINPGTPISALEPVLHEIDLVLVMSVEPGFYGQAFIETTYQRVQTLRDLIGERNIVIEADGGINAGNIGGLASSGVRMVVAGSYCFQGDGVNERVQTLKSAAGAPAGH
ncbi:MAG: ribulose-phosphate 3-epimerase [Spirochaetales bacterium]|nr:ribulose-phosphate 3-epimerase [Leptospiraceae bacterium]MCP5483799.1 ribulose-phosphate 3-epimerase [Spirochaetales bacterium]